jgi:hypothetical protein
MNDFSKKTIGILDLKRFLCYIVYTKCDNLCKNGEGNDTENKYSSILFLPHHHSKIHPSRGRANYAAQFSPFAALAGYEGIVRETARYTECRGELDESEKMRIFRRLKIIIDRIGENDEVIITYFVPDKVKSGGAYATVRGTVKKFDAVKGIVTLTNETEIHADDIFSIDADIIDRFMPDDI